MHSSSYYSSILSQLKSVKAQVQGVLGYFDSCEATLNKSIGYIDEITINGEAIDQGKLSEVGNSLKNAESDLQAIVNECNAKIAEYTTLYNQAVAREEAAAREARRRAAEAAAQAAKTNNTTTSVR